MILHISEFLDFRSVGINFEEFLVDFNGILLLKRPWSLKFAPRWPLSGQSGDHS